ncbi:MAG TPA: hypothetical protein VE131_13095 [Terriglobales bacterium]|nr:hypothetical protein [Terriglobales bacterium]
MPQIGFTEIGFIRVIRVSFHIVQIRRHRQDEGRDYLLHGTILRALVKQAVRTAFGSAADFPK